MDSNILNIKCVTLSWCLYVLSNTLRNIWGSIHEKVKQHWSWIGKRKRCLYKKACNLFFVYIALTGGWNIKLGELEIDQKNFPNKLGIPENVKK